MPTEAWDTRFLSVVNNEPRDRENGFAVLVRKASSLQALQALCFDERCHNRCLTVRYRLSGGPVFGTLIATFLTDVATWQNDKLAVAGDMLPAYAGSEWPSLAAGLIADVVGSAQGSEQLGHKRGNVTDEILERLIEQAASSLRPSQRLILFAEVTGPTPVEEWKRGLETLLSRLPMRVGIVLSGAPAGFSLPAEDPSFLELDTIPDASTGVAAYRYRDSALQDDSPATSDRLGVGPFADSLARLVLLPETGPMTIGIHGPWGMGKSSFMGFIEEALVRRAPTNHENERKLVQLDQAIDERDRSLEDPGEDRDAVQRRRDELTEQRFRLYKRMTRAAEADVIAVTFNAWRFEDATQIWAGLAETITGRLEHALSRPARLWARLRYAWSRRRAQLVEELVLPGIFAVLAVAVLALFGYVRIESVAETWAESSGVPVEWIAALPGALLLALAAWFVAGRARRALKPISDRVGEYLQMPDYRERMGFQHEVLRDVEFSRDCLTRRRLRQHRRRPRVVVFIDDLDRCSDEKIIDALQAINLILGPAASGFYVFLGIDTRMVQRAIDRRYGLLTDGAALEHFEPSDFADRYLRKIIQLSFHLTYATPRDYLLERDTTPTQNLVRHLFSPAARSSSPLAGSGEAGETPGRNAARDSTTGGLSFDRSAVREPLVQVLREVEDSPEELADFLEFHSYVGDNPRDLVRLVNVYRLAKLLLQRPEISATRESQRKLIKWLTFCARWPSLIYAVLNAPTEGLDDPILQVAKVDDHAKDSRDELLKFAAIEPVLSAEDLSPTEHLAFAAKLTTQVFHDPLRPHDDDAGEAKPTSSQ
ncbi:KAP family NTPase [Solirubrobacter ginsenosidimutans]|uniref:KAP family NTPase n=1 Tax=Solirubrobacter ginsenosidimutans TaxID=490573 RepID=A0A9X3S442_9ACTN|nr:P-loop NTPase fold protein [Solirubrobacter ginsenosidimutans]MDA0165284.1 KAP family NTPase [Solirubrobacter ginsenosidimutans]